MAAERPAYRLRPRAETDLEDIWRYTLSRWSLRQADDYIRSISDAFAGLAAGTKRGRATDIRQGYFKYAIGSHVIYYVEPPGGVEIVRVLHGRMDVARQL